jgi:hypothetical protein
MAFLTITDGLPAAKPMNSLRVHLKGQRSAGLDGFGTDAALRRQFRSDGVLLNMTLMQKYWTSHPPSPAPVVLDIDSPATSGDLYGSLKTAFGVATDLLFASGGEAAVLADYHAHLVPPFCLSAVKSFFDAH